MATVTDSRLFQTWLIFDPECVWKHWNFPLSILTCDKQMCLALSQACEWVASNLHGYAILHPLKNIFVANNLWENVCIN